MKILSLFSLFSSPSPFLVYWIICLYWVFSGILIPFEFIEYFRFIQIILFTLTPLRLLSIWIFFRLFSTPFRLLVYCVFVVYKVDSLLLLPAEFIEYFEFIELFYFSFILLSLLSLFLLLFPFQFIEFFEYIELIVFSLSPMSELSILSLLSLFFLFPSEIIEYFEFFKFILYLFPFEFIEYLELIQFILFSFFLLSLLSILKL